MRRRVRRCQYLVRCVKESSDFNIPEHYSLAASYTNPPYNLTSTCCRQPYQCKYSVTRKWKVWIGTQRLCRILLLCEGTTGFIATKYLAHLPSMAMMHPERHSLVSNPLAVSGRLISDFSSVQGWWPILI